MSPSVHPATTTDKRVAAGAASIAIRLSAGSSRARGRDWDAAAKSVPLALGQHQRFVGVVPSGDHDEMRAVEVDVALQAVVGVPSDLAVAADDCDESITRPGVCPGIVESACFCHPGLLVVRWPNGSVDPTVSGPSSRGAELGAVDERGIPHEGPRISFRVGSQETSASSATTWVSGRSG
jgi:hypothetical protein